MRQKRWQLHKIWCSSATSVVRAKAVNIICTMCFRIPAIKTLRPAVYHLLRVSKHFSSKCSAPKVFDKGETKLPEVLNELAKTQTSLVKHFLCSALLMRKCSQWHQWSERGHPLKECFSGITVEWGTTPGQGLRRIEMIRTSAKLRELTVSSSHWYLPPTIKTVSESVSSITRAAPICWKDELEFILSNIEDKCNVLCNLGKSKK